jgi:hypothetical protein
MDKPITTDWAALRDHNPDRTQMAAAGAIAGPAAGASADLDQLAAEIVDHCEIGEAPYFTRERADLIVYVAGQIRQALAAAQPGYDALAAERDELRVALEVEQGARATVLYEWNLGIRLRNAVLAWHEGTGIDGDALDQQRYETVLRLAGIELGTPAGPPVAAAGAGLDVERLVDVLHDITRSVDLRWGDQRLVDHYRAAFDAADEAGDARTISMRAGMRALVLAALGIEPALDEQTVRAEFARNVAALGFNENGESTTTRPDRAATTDESEAR